MSHAIESEQHKYDGINAIQELENDCIYLASKGLVIEPVIAQMMCLTKRFLGETNSYFEENNG